MRKKSDIILRTCLIIGDALALVIAKVFRVNVSRAYLITDTIVLLLSLSYIPFENIACSLVTVMLSLWASKMERTI